MNPYRIHDLEKKMLRMASEEMLFKTFCKGITDRVELKWWQKVLVFLRLKKKPTRIDWFPNKGETIVFRRYKPFGETK